MHVLYGSSSGLTARGTQWWTPSSRDAAGHHLFDGEVNTFWPKVGDFNADGRADLVIEYFVEDEGPVEGRVLWGGPDGLTTRGALRITSPDVVGDLTGDGIDDLYAPDMLAIGTNLEDTGDCVYLGSRTRPLRTSFCGSPQMAPGRGHMLGDVDGDHQDEVIALGERLSTGVDVALAITHLQSKAGRAKSTLTYADLGVPSRFEARGGIVGDVTGDGAADVLLALALRGADFEANPREAFAVIRGAPHVGITAQKAQVWSQVTPGIPGAQEAGDGFGSAFQIGAYRAAAVPQVAVGIPGEDRGRGRVILLSGSSTGLNTSGYQNWSQDTAGVKGHAETGDRFGAPLR